MKIGIYKHSCEHKNATGKSLKHCPDCLKTWSLIDKLFQPVNRPLNEIIGVRPDQISLYTNVNKARICLKNICTTQYFAGKRVFETAVSIFDEQTTWDKIYIRPPFKDGFVEGVIYRGDIIHLLSLFGVVVSGPSIRKHLIEEGCNLEGLFVRTFIEQYTTTRLGKYIKPGSRLERFLARITKNEYFTRRKK